MGSIENGVPFRLIHFHNLVNFATEFISIKQCNLLSQLVSQHLSYT